MDWTNSLSDASAVDNATYYNKLLDDHPSLSKAASYALGLASVGDFAGIGEKLNPDFYSRVRNENPYTYRGGQATLLAPMVAAGVPAMITAPFLLSAIARDPALRRLINDGNREPQEVNLFRDEHD